jgi:hypothetical protein
VIKALRAMLAAGASAEMIVLAVEAAYTAEEDRKARQAEYMREYRKGVSLRKITTPPSPPMINNSTPSPSPDLANAKSVKSPFPESLFEDFWSVYPRKVGKGEAKKAFRNALKRATAEEIIAGAKRYAASKPEPEYTKHPGPWLNADRWADEPARKANTVLAGPWKPVAPEPEMPKISEEERARNLAKLTGIVSNTLKWNEPRG